MKDFLGRILSVIFDYNILYICSLIMLILGFCGFVTISFYCYKIQLSIMTSSVYQFYIIACDVMCFCIAYAIYKVISLKRNYDN